MPTLTIQGRKVKVGDEFLSMTPEQQNDTVEEIAASLGVQVEEAETDQSKALRSELSQITQNASPENRGSFARGVDSFGRGAADIMSFGMADELAAAGGALTGIGGEFGNYDRNLRVQRITQDQRDMADPVASTTGRIAGGITQGVGMAKSGLSLLGNVPASAGLGAKVGAGALEGAAYGGAYGLGSGEGVSDRISQGLGGAAAGGLIGGAVPVVASTVKAAAKPLVDAVSARVNPGKYASTKIAERLSNSNMTVDQAAKRMEDSGLSLADVGGKTTRNLLRTASNIPGKGSDRIATQLTLRQMGQGDRLKSVIKDVFADPDGFITANDRLSKEWAKIGDEVYEPALKQKVVWTDRLKQFVDEPIFQRGLAQGVKIQRLESLASGKPFNPTDYAITGFNAAGDPIISGVPNMRTLNVAKKGIDALIGDMKNPLTGKLTEEGRATNLVQKAFLDEIDSWNSAYPKARQVWGGFAKVKEALEFGQKEALEVSPEAVAKSFKAMSESERQAARIGIAEALRKRIDGAGYTQNAILKFFSNRRNVGVLRAAFPDAESFKTFRQAIFAEAKKRGTYEAVKGNSTTAAQLADMMETGGLQEGFNTARTAVTAGPVSATIQWVGSRLKMLGGMTPDVADSLAQKLMASNPEKVRQVAAELAQIEKAQITGAQRSNAVQSIITRALQAPVQSMALQPQ